MIIFLYGEDDFRSQQKLNEIIKHYKKIHQTGFNLKYFDFEKQEFNDFRDSFQTKSMFREKKLFVLKNFFSNQEFKQKFLANKNQFLNSQNTIVFFQKGEPNKKNSLFLFLNKKAKTQQFRPLKIGQLENWIKKELKSQETPIESPALKLLISYSNNNLWQLSNEIKKLVHYKASTKNKKITKQDIEKLVAPKIELNIFKTIDAIAEKNKQKALFLIRQHLEKGESPLYLLAMISFQFRNLLMVKEKSTRSLNMHPFVLRKSLWLSQKFTFQQLKQIYQKIAQIDLGIKTGKIEPGLALDLFIAGI